MNRAWQRRSAGGLALAVCLGCAVGPRFVPPRAPEGQRLTRDALPDPLAPTASEGTQRLADAPAPAEWWTLFQSPRLDEVVALALRASPSLEAARARWRETREAVAVARGAALPAVEIGVAPRHASRTRAPYSAGAKASFTIDAFGKTRREIERAGGLADAQRAELDATRLALAGNAVAQAIAIASLREQAAAFAEQVHADDEQTALATARERAGRSARGDVLSARIAAERDRAQLPALEQQLAAAQHALAVTAGQPPAEWAPPDFMLDELQLPEQIPRSIPSELVRRRPDIRAAEARVHAANAQIGVATAELYPHLDVSAALGAKLGGGGGVAAALAGQLLTPVFRGGALRAARRSARDAHAAALADYRESVLSGLQQVADLLLALEHDAQPIDAARRALDAASESLALEQARFAAGKLGRSPVLSAQRTLAESRVQHARACAQRLADTAALFVAIGGGDDAYRAAP